MMPDFSDYGLPPDTRPGFYYVSARNDSGNYWLMRGPFADHASALEATRATMLKAVDLDPRAHWMSGGTCRSEDDRGLGKLNTLEAAA